MNNYDQENAQCFVYTQKEGLLSAAAHDLKIRVSRFAIQIDDASVRGSFDPSSLQVICATHHGIDAPTALSSRDRATIEENILGEVLHATAFPVIEFTSDAVVRTPDGSRIDGQLHLHGTTRPLSVFAKQSIECEVVLDQRDFGIKPYSAMLGSLRVQPHVRVVLKLVPPAKP